MSDAVADIIAIEPPCETAEELIERLSPQHPSWEAPDRWIYRGQSDDYPLLAKAHRSRAVFNGLGVESEIDASSSDRDGLHHAELAGC